MNAFDAAQGKEEDTNNGLVTSPSAPRFDHALSVSDASPITHYVNTREKDYSPHLSFASLLTELESVLL